MKNFHFTGMAPHCVEATFDRITQPLSKTEEQPVCWLQSVFDTGKCHVERVLSGSPSISEAPVKFGCL